jgi:hypothetical protein
MIVNPRGRDVRMTEPFLHLDDVGLVVERVGRGGGPERVRAIVKPSSLEYARTSL